MPTLSFEMNTPMTLVKNSGALPPAAMNVAPATSSLIGEMSASVNISNWQHFENTRLETLGVYLQISDHKNTFSHSFHSILSPRWPDAGLHTLLICSFSVMTANDGTKNSSHTIA
jgi:hypothetical protein